MKNLKAWFNRTFKHKQLDMHIKSLSIDVEKQTAQMHLEHPVFMEFMSSCVDIFDNSDPPNYLTIRFFNVANMRYYEVTIRPEDNLSPYKITGRLRNALETISRGENEYQCKVASQALEACGYEELPME